MKTKNCPLDLATEKPSATLSRTVFGVMEIKAKLEWV